MQHTHPAADGLAVRPRSGAIRTAVVALAIVAGTATIPATALAGGWGPKSSYYGGVKRVTGDGTMTRHSNRSQSRVTACDNYNEGWPVYAYSDWTDLAPNGGFTSRGTPGSGGCTTGDWSMGWWGASGFWVRAKVCAQVGWPVPDNCTSYNSEAHRP